MIYIQGDKRNDRRDQIPAEAAISGDECQDETKRWGSLLWNCASDQELSVEGKTTIAFEQKGEKEQPIFKMRFDLIKFNLVFYFNLKIQIKCLEIRLFFYVIYLVYIIKFLHSCFVYLLLLINCDIHIWL